MFRPKPGMRAENLHDSYREARQLEVRCMPPHYAAPNHEPDLEKKGAIEFKMTNNTHQSPPSSAVIYHPHPAKIRRELEHMALSAYRVDFILLLADVLRDRVPKHI